MCRMEKSGSASVSPDSSVDFLPESVRVLLSHKPAKFAMDRIPANQLAVRLAKRPRGDVKPGEDLVVDKTAKVQQDLGDGEILVRNLWLSLDPAMRGWMDDARNYIPPVAIGEVMRGGCVGEVVASRSNKFPVGCLVQGMFGWQQYAKSGPKGVVRVEPPPGIPPSAFLGVLGLTGMTAYFGLLDVGAPRQGQTVLISAAAGATGSVAAQIAKHVVGCRVVGIAGGAEKCRWLVEELGLDAAIDYKDTSVPLHRRIKETCPNGIDVFFDNVGGDQLDAALVRLAQNARVVLCGAISRYNSSHDLPPGPKHYMNLLVKSARMEGFVVFNYAHKYKKAAEDLGAWVSAGKIKFKEDVVEGGLEAAADGLLRLFRGANKGKLIVRVADPSPRARL